MNKSAFYDQFARIGKAVASPHRIELLDLLVQGERTVEALSEICGISIASTSQHLRHLHAARLVDCTRDGSYMRYRIAGSHVPDFLVCLQRLAEEQLTDLASLAKKQFSHIESLESVDRPKLMRQVKRGEVTLIDVRPAEEYSVAHLPGAISIPLPTLAQRLSELPRGNEIVAYCRGKYCVLAAEAVELLTSKKLVARRLADSVGDWRAAGLPVLMSTASTPKKKEKIR